MSEVKLGELATKEGKRDAIHVAVIPVCAASDLQPGDKIWLTKYGSATPNPSKGIAGGMAPIGVVDPFLKGPIVQGQWFWLLLRPGSISGLRHDWTHTDFPPQSADDYDADANCREMGCD